MREGLKAPLIALLAVAILNAGVPEAAVASTDGTMAFDGSTTRSVRFSEIPMPRLAEIRIGSSLLSMESVRNGVVIRKAATGESVVLTNAELAQYRVVDERQNNDGSVDVAFVSPDPFGAPERIQMHLLEMTESGVSGYLSRGTTSLPFAYTTFDGDSRAGGSALGPGGLRSTSGEAIVLVIVLSAAVIGAAGCAAAALLTNCISDCGSACYDCSGGQCAMQSASEGLCGTCTCTCQCGDFTRQFITETGC